MGYFSVRHLLRMARPQLAKVPYMINKITSILWRIWFVILMTIVGLLLPFLLICKLFLPLKKYRYLVFLVASTWGKLTVLSTGSKVRIEGLELIPKDARLCFIGNHQSFFDIPAFLGFLKRPVGFIAKQELFKIPILSHWMQQIPCVFIDRDSARKAMESFKFSAEIIKQKMPLAIFPEGGRSMGAEMGTFRKGSLKLAMMGDAIIVPFVLKDTWKIYEIDHGIHKANVKIRILTPITPEDPIYHDKDSLLEHIYSQIKSNLEQM